MTTLFPLQRQEDYMDRKINGVLDVSPFLLVEGSADSEMDDESLTLLDNTFIAGDDDAESCSCDSPVFDFADDADHHINNVHGDDHHCLNNCNMWWPDLGFECIAPEEEEGGGDEEEVSLEFHKTRQAKHEMEDKLFWETCMELGLDSASVVRHV